LTKNKKAIGGRFSLQKQRVPAKCVRTTSYITSFTDEGDGLVLTRSAAPYGGGQVKLNAPLMFPEPNDIALIGKPGELFLSPASRRTEVLRMVSPRSPRPNGAPTNGTRSIEPFEWDSSPEDSSYIYLTDSHACLGLPVFEDTQV
jgi:hypothetical protein